jgi:hypothetical protein
LASGVRRTTKALILHLSGSLRRVKHGLLLVLLSRRRRLLLIPTLLLLVVLLLTLPLLLGDATVGLL